MSLVHLYSDRTVKEKVNTFSLVENVKLKLPIVPNGLYSATVYVYQVIYGASAPFLRTKKHSP